MKRKRHKNQHDKNQLMMFTDIEMSGEWEGSARIDSGNEDASYSKTDESSHPDESSIQVEQSAKTIETDSTLTYNSDTVSHSTKELAELVDKLSDDEASLVAMHSSLLVHKDLSPDGVYSIPSLPGMKFDKKSIQRMAYVSVSRSFPNMIQSIGLDFEDELH